MWPGSSVRAVLPSHHPVTATANPAALAQRLGGVRVALSSLGFDPVLLSEDTGRSIGGCVLRRRNGLSAARFGAGDAADGSRRGQSGISATMITTGASITARNMSTATARRLAGRRGRWCARTGGERVGR